MTSHEDYQSLDRRERELLVALDRAPMAYAEGRNWTPEMRALSSKGLMFSAHGLQTITPKGREVRERVA